VSSSTHCLTRAPRASSAVDLAYAELLAVASPSPSDPVPAVGEPSSQPTPGFFVFRLPATYVALGESLAAAGRRWCSLQANGAVTHTRSLQPTVEHCLLALTTLLAHPSSGLQSTRMWRVRRSRRFADAPRQTRAGHAMLMRLRAPESESRSRGGGA
jgi:hypothetical protein